MGRSSSDMSTENSVVTTFPSVNRKQESRESFWRSITGNPVPVYRKLISIVFLAFVVRVAVRGYLGGQYFWENGYTFFFALAKDIALGNGVLTASRVPLYPMFLAAVTFGHQVFLPVLVAQSLIGAGTVLCAGLIARELFGDAAAMIAAALTAFYPYYVVHDTALQETGLYTFLMTLAVLLLLYVRRSGSVLTAAAAGLMLGAAVLTRANLAPFALLAPLWLALAGGLNALPWQRRIKIAVVCAGAGMLTVTPWLTRVYHLTGSVALSTESGFFLWLGNNPYTFSYYPQESIDRSQAVALAARSTKDLNEVDARQHNEELLDEWYRKRALDYMRSHPRQTLENGFRKLAAAFGWLPSPRRSFWPSLAHVLSYGPVMILGLWGMWASRTHWLEHSIFYVQFLAFATVTAVFFGHTGYRAYLDVFWIVFAAGLLAAWLRKSQYSRLSDPEGSLLLPGVAPDGVPPHPKR